MDCGPPGFCVHEIFPGKDTGVGCHFLFQGIFPTQGSNSGLWCCRQILYRLSYKESPGFLLKLDSSAQMSPGEVSRTSLKLGQTKDPCHLQALQFRSLYPRPWLRSRAKGLSETLKPVPAMANFCWMGMESLWQREGEELASGGNPSYW